MRHGRLIGFIVVTFALASTLAACSSAEKKPSAPVWPVAAMHRGDAGRSGLFAGPGPDPALTPTIRWTYQAGSAVISSSVVAAGMVVAGGDDGKVHAIDAVTGAVRWTFAAGGPVQSSPAIADGVVYVGSADANLYAVDAKTGAERWRFATGGAVAASPVVDGGNVFAGSDGGSLYRLAAADGKEQWHVALPAAVRSPAVSGGLVYARAGHVIAAIDIATGEEIWQVDVGSDEGSAPAVAGGLLYAGSYDGNLYAFDAATGASRWTFATGDAIAAMPALAGDLAVVDSYDRYLYGIDTATGAERWRFFTGGGSYAAPAVAEGVVYVARGSYYLLAVDLATGARRWGLRIGEDEIIASPAVAGGAVFAAIADGSVVRIGQVDCGALKSWVSDARGRVNKVDKMYDRIHKRSFWNNPDDAVGVVDGYPDTLRALASDQRTSEGPAVVVAANDDLADVYLWLANRMQKQLEDSLLWGVLGEGIDQIFGGEDAKNNADILYDTVKSTVAAEDDFDLPAMLVDTALGDAGCQ